MIFFPIFLKTPFFLVCSVHGILRILFCRKYLCCLEFPLHLQGSHPTFTALLEAVISAYHTLHKKWNCLFFLKKCYWTLKLHYCSSESTKLLSGIFFQSEDIQISLSTVQRIEHISNGKCCGMERSHKTSEDKRLEMAILKHCKIILTNFSARIQNLRKIFWKEQL